MKKIHLLIAFFLFGIGGLRAQTDIVITEIGYDQAETGADSTEFIELYNKGAAAINMQDYYFSAGVAYVFPEIIIEPGDYIVLAIDSMAMISTYGYVGAYQWTAGDLNDGGEGITLRTGGHSLVDAASYNDVSPWPVGAAGTGKTIVLCDPEANNALGANWVLSETNAGITVGGLDVYGSPGELDLACIDCETTTASYSVESCLVYTVPSGDETYDLSGIYMDTIPNVLGCDSVMTIDVTILEASVSTIAEETCTSYTVPSGDETYFMTGVYMDTLTNILGCDSIITIELTIHPSTSSEITVVTCGSYTVPSGDETYDVDGVYMDTIPNLMGCDSVITINLSTFGEASESEITEVVCGSYTVPSGDETYDVSGIYTDTLTNEAGCDSIITIDLTVVMNSETEITIDTCHSYTVPSGDETYTESGVYTDTLTNIAGCDSIIIIDLSIPSINDGIVATATDVKSIQAGADYQWLDCDNDMEPIDGANDQVFEPESPGNYAVEVTVAGCSIITECAFVAAANIGEDDPLDLIRIYPNPSSGLLNIDLGNLEQASVRIMSIDGKMVYQITRTSDQFIQVDLETVPGIYFVEVQQNGITKQFKWIVEE